MVVVVSVCVAKGGGGDARCPPPPHALLHQYWISSYDILVEGPSCNVFHGKRVGRCVESEESRNCVQCALTIIDV